MNKQLFFLLSRIFFIVAVKAQTSVGIGIYPTGTETGIGLRTAKDSKWMMDARITKANLYNTQTLSSFITEASAICRIVKLEKIRFHIGIGIRTEWNFGGKNDKLGGIIPIGVEAFPFPFQNAGLIFEAAPFYTSDFASNYYAGIRTIAGFVFYFPSKEIKEIKTN